MRSLDEARKLPWASIVTAALSFERAPEQLIGKRGEGFEYMLTLMNGARVGVGFECIGLMEAAIRLASEYAAGRRSMGKTIDPVTAQSLANDPGQANARNNEALSNSALFDEGRSKQHLLFNQNDERLLEKPGAGLLPKVEGPNIVIAPPVTEGTRVSAAPE